MRGTTNAQTIGGTVGSDTKPVKIVGGVATEVANTLQKTITITNGSASNVSAPNGTSTIITNPTVTAGTYIVSARFSSSGYSSGGGFFAHINNINHATFPFISGLTPIGSVTCIIQTLSGGTIPLGITQYSGSTMAFSVEYSLIKIA